MAIKVLHVDKDYVDLPLVTGGIARAVVWPGMGAKHAALHYVVMPPGQENVPHKHSYSEDVIYVIKGRGFAVDLDSNVEHEFKPGCVIFIEPGTTHTIRSVGPDDYVVVGAMSPHDVEFYRKAGLKW